MRPRNVHMARFKQAVNSWAVGLVLAGALALAGCAPDAEVRGADDLDGDVPLAERYGGTAVIAGITGPKSMNSLTVVDGLSWTIQREVLFMPLVKYGRDLQPIPWLAEQWDTVRVAPDALELTFRLRPDVKWHDGTPTTARDVKFTFDRAVDPRTGFAGASFLEPYSPRAEVLDDHTIRFRMRPHAEFLEIWYRLAIMPEHVLGPVPPEQLRNAPFNTEHPVGNGPFRFVRHVPNQEWVFDANPDFPSELGGRPRLDRVVYRTVPEETTLLAELLTGRVDVYLGVNPTQAGRIKESGAAELQAYAPPSWVFIAWNTRRPLFQDARVRRALTMAIDRRTIVDALLPGAGMPGRSVVTPAHWAHDRGDPAGVLPYDPARARALLAAAGWRDRDANGVLENGQGEEFRFALATSQGNQTHKDILEVIQAQLRPLGVVAEPQILEFAAMTERAARSRDFDAIVAGWGDFFGKNDTNLLHSRRTDGPAHYTGYTHPRVDSLLDTLARPMAREQAQPLWREYQRLLAQEAPYTVLYYPTKLSGVSTRLRDVEMDARGEFDNISRWWIPPSQRRAPTGGASRP